MRLIVLAALLITAPAYAQQSSPAEVPPRACYVMDTELPPGLADWKGSAAIASATGTADAGKASLELGKGYEAGLLNTPRIAFPVQPEKPGGTVAHAGLFEFTVPAAGNYTVALSTAAWIDVIESGKAVAPTSFGHGPECTSIRKMVVFPLQAGKHTLQVSGDAQPAMRIMVAKTS
jgi:hypothetical protein